MNIARSINVAMAKNDMSRTDLARAMVTTNQNIHYLIKTGRASSETLRRLAAAFNMPVSELIKLGED